MLVGSWEAIVHAAVKAALMYVTALVALRLGERRTLAQWTIIDFATAVAVGAIIGRTAIADDQAFAPGAVALVVLVAVHRVASILRFNPVLNKLFDHRVRVLVDEGRLRHRELRRCGLTDNDVYAQLRQRGVFRLEDVKYVLYETRGSITIVPRRAPADSDLVDAGLRNAAGFDPTDTEPAG